MSGQRQKLGNFILDSLPQEEYDRLSPHLQLIELRQNQVLVEMRQPITQVYFPITALLSWVQSTSDGETVEVGATGFEGMVGTTLLLDRAITPWEVLVIITGTGYSLDAETFVRLLHQSTVLHQKIAAFTYMKLMQLTQSALCNRFHTMEQRLCRWLLAANDRVNTPDLALTREILATMIGAHRPGVSLVTGTLQTAGLIRAMRGKVTIVDRSEMEEATCECYHILKQEFDRYLSNET